MAAAIAMITVVCLLPRCGINIQLSKDDEWTIPADKAARLIAAGQVRLKDPADAAKLPKVTAAPPPPVVVLDNESGADEFEESDALTGDDAGQAEASADPKPKTALGKAQAKKAAAKKPKAQ